MKKATALIAACFLSLSLFAFSTSLDIDPQGWQNTSRATQENVILQPGMPMLPFIPVRILLPFGEVYQNAELSLSEPQLMANSVDIAIAREQLPISENGLYMYFTDNEKPRQSYKSAQIANNQNQFLPQKSWEFLGTQYYRGYQVALFNVYPYKYNPFSKQVLASSSVNITINSNFSTSEAAYQANFVTPNPETRQVIESLVLNPQAINTYNSSFMQYRNVPATNRTIDLTNPKKMIIITNNQCLPWFSEYANWRSTMGVSTAIYSMEDIVTSYPGSDNAEKVRNFIIHAYQTWATSSEPLQYVILGGDDEIVPERGCYGQVGDTIDLRMPVDIYFSNLDGNWNANGNLIFGEVADSPDMMPEIHIGRFPAETLAEFQNIFRKTRYYAEQNTFSNNVALFIGENLNWNPVTWGGDYKDDVAQYLPTTYTLDKLYQRDGSYNSSAVWNAINNGAGIMNHMGHANEFTLMGQSNGSVESMQNSEYGFLYSQGCYPAAFDQRTSSDGESIGEHLVTASGALFAFIGNSRYGWYMPGDINGASQYYDRQFFRGLFEQNQPQLGKALTYSRLQNLNSALTDDVMRWCYYEVVLFGDPSIAVKPADPNLPYLNLTSYSLSDVEGDGDGTINPGEVIRFYPVVTNNANAGTAMNVSVRLESAINGVEILDPSINIPQILPGGSNPSDFFIRIQIPQDLSFGLYNMKVVVDSHHPQNNQTTGERRFDASFEITLFDNRFPWETSFAGKSAPLVEELSPQAGLEILYVDVYGNGYIIGNDGETISTFAAPAGMNINRSFAYGPIDTEAGGDLAFCSRSGHIYASSITGANIFSYHADTSFLFTPVLADLDGDGYSETIAGGLDGKLYAVQANGYMPFGFPVDLGSAFHCELAAADFDDDGIFEIVAGTSEGKLYVLDGQGNIKPGFPIQFTGSITGSPTITNGKRIVCATGTQIHIVSPDGVILNSRNIDTHITGGFAMADLTNDDWGMDIVGVSLSGVVYAFDQNGLDLSGFPVATGVNFSCPPLIANMDDDPELEIVLHSYVNSVYGFNHDGSPLSGFPFITTYNGSSPASLIDFDGDGFTKMVMGHSNGVLMLNLRRSASGLAPWTTFRGSSMRQGSFASTGYVGNEDNLQNQVITSLMQNYPNPFNPSTTINFSIAKPALAKLEIFNIKGQKVVSLLNDTKAAGAHSIVWDGRDEKGRGVSSGVYLYRLNVEGKTLQRRMLLLK